MFKPDDHDQKHIVVHRVDHLVVLLDARLTVDQAGQHLAELHELRGRVDGFAMLTGVRARTGTLYFGSLTDTPSRSRRGPAPSVSSTP